MPLRRNDGRPPWGEFTDFLLSTDGREFSRGEFAKFLSEHSRNDRNKYGTAGRFMRVLREGGILEHNRKKANQARCRLAGIFLDDGGEGPSAEMREEAYPEGCEAPGNDRGASTVCESVPGRV